MITSARVWTFARGLIQPLVPASPGQLLAVGVAIGVVIFGAVALGGRWEAIGIGDHLPDAIAIIAAVTAVLESVLALRDSVAARVRPRARVTAVAGAAFGAIANLIRVSFGARRSRPPRHVGSRAHAAIQREHRAREPRRVTYATASATSSAAPMRRRAGGAARRLGVGRRGGLGRSLDRHDPGRDADDAHAVGRPLAREAGGEAVERGLGRRVGRHPPRPTTRRGSTRSSRRTRGRRRRRRRGMRRRRASARAAAARAG